MLTRGRHLSIASFELVSHLDVERILPSECPLHLANRSVSVSSTCMEFEPQKTSQKNDSSTY